MAGLPEIARRRLSRAPGVGDHPDAGLLTAFVEGTLTKSHRDNVLDHLVTCSGCNRLVALIAPVREAGRVLLPAEARRRWFVRTPMRWAAATAAIAVVVSAVVIGRIGHQVGVPPVPSTAVEKAPSANAQLSAQLTVQPNTPRSVKKLLQQAPSLRRRPQSGTPSPQPALAQVNASIAPQSLPALPGDIRDQTTFQTSMFTSAESWLEPSPVSIEPPLKAEPPANIPAAPSAPTGPLWLVSDAGVLQKSNDSGHTWVPVVALSRVPLRALSVLGEEIWAGGDKGALYHSSDAGQTWIAVVPISNSAALSEDIVRIAFSDLRHGWIATRNGDIWTTRDGGATWSAK
jgi:hypothetical protein